TKIIQRAVAEDKGMADHRRLPWNGEVETRARRRPAARSDDRPVLIFGAPAEKHVLLRGELVVDLGIVCPPFLSALECSLVLGPETAGIHREELIFLCSFIGSEEVRFVLGDGAADRSPILITPVIRLRRLERLYGGDRGIAEEQQSGTVQPVRAGF